MTNSLCVAAILTLLCLNIPGSAQNLDSAIFTQSLVSKGDASRLDHVFLKAQKGDPITVAVIGGSITQGAKASTPEKQYGSLIAAWWQKQFPKSKITFVNAGIGATGSDYGALRAKRDLLSHHPDFVVVEYAVNDGGAPFYAETLEGLIRQILKQPNHPAIIMLFMMNNIGGNVQASQTPVGAHYSLPMISYRDAFWPEIAADQMKKEAIFADEVHPNDTGHAYAAQLVIHFLQDTLDNMPTSGQIPRISSLPKPLISNLFEHVRLYGIDDLKPTLSQGWQVNKTAGCWESNVPGSVLEFDVSGKELLATFFRIRGAMGRAAAQVDNQPPVTLEGWFDQTWGGYLVTQPLAAGLSKGKHHIRFELSREKNPDSTGFDFKIFYIGAAGVR
jgi:lysophospholipase L1-like esterase